MSDVCAWPGAVLSQRAVDACHNCPMRGHYQGENYCAHPAAPEPIATSLEGAADLPDECPLRQGPLELRLKEVE